MFFALHIVIQL